MTPVIDVDIEMEVALADCARWGTGQGVVGLDMDMCLVALVRQQRPRMTSVLSRSEPSS